MLSEQKYRELDLTFKRILTMPVTRSTFRQMQNAIFSAVEGDREKATQLLEALLTGDPKGEKSSQSTLFQDFVSRYAVTMGVAREVSERGEFVNLVTSDILNHPELPIFGNRIRRVDGKEFEFLTDPESTIQLLLHFSSRLNEMEKMDKSKKALGGLKSHLTALKSQLEQLLASAT